MSATLASTQCRRKCDEEPDERGSSRLPSCVAMGRIFLSPPDIGGDERRMLLDAFDSGWVAPVGPDLAQFEMEFARSIGVPNTVALSSGTAGLHLALICAGVQAGDDVIVSSFTFAASAFPVRYLGAEPVFIDSDDATWNLDPALLAEELANRARVNRLPRAVMAVDLYGHLAAYDEIAGICAEYSIPLIEDATEALGAAYNGTQAGGFGMAAVFSFNGNKPITTSGGGMVASHDANLIDRMHYLATQARQPVAHYEHTEVGYNYRLSNLLAAVGRGQLMHLDVKLKRRRAINERYRRELHIPGLGFAPIAPGHEPNCWLTCITVDRRATGGVGAADVHRALAAADIESRPLWKPMHQQPVFRDARCRLNGVSDRLFATGLCLPSGSGLTEEEQDHVIATVQHVLRSH